MDYRGSFALRLIREASSGVIVALRDSRPELHTESLDAFSTVLHDQARRMDMGLSICRSIVEAQGGTSVGGEKRLQRVHAFFSASLPIA
jgi:K+-sensing histidine kinase KdpD